MAQRVNKQTECVLAQVTEYYPHTHLWMQSTGSVLVDFDKLYLNEFPTLTTQTMHNAAQ